MRACLPARRLSSERCSLAAAGSSVGGRARTTRVLRQAEQQRHAARGASPAGQLDDSQSSRSGPAGGVRGTRGGPPRAAQLSGLNGPLVLRLDVGLPSTKPLLDQHDLDNYAFPLATRLAKRDASSRPRGARSGIPRSPRFASRRQPQQRGAAARLPWSEVHTTASAESTDYKQQIHDQLAAHDPLPEGPVSLQMSYTVGRGRSWPNLWKPTIDALDRILGRTTPGRQWHPRDGRIVELGLHCHVDDTLGNNVRIAIAATIHRD